MGHRFTVNAPRIGTCLWKPDIVLPKYKTVVLVHGCFWHRHPGCANSRMPATRRNYWKTKFERNVKRDRINQKRLEEEGWKVLVLWECELGDEE